MEDELFFLRLDWGDYSTNEERMKAIFNINQFLSREMSLGRVPQNKKELKNDINNMSTPLSIAFVKMAEKGDIDEMTASENANLFLEWDEKSSFKLNELRQRDGKLYRCLQAHTGQAGWEPENTPALWKLIGIDENGIPYWSQPISQADSYMLDAETNHNNLIWVSDLDYNVWEPGVYGWHVKEEITSVDNLEVL